MMIRIRIGLGGAEDYDDYDSKVTIFHDDDNDDDVGDDDYDDD